MQFKYIFRNMKHSKKIVEHVELKAQKLQKFEVKPVSATVTMCVERGRKSVHIHARGRDLVLEAQAKESSFEEAIDKAIQRMATQMSKKKAKVQNHKCPERSHMGKIEQLSPALEFLPIGQANNEEEQEAA